MQGRPFICTCRQTKVVGSEEKERPFIDGDKKIGAGVVMLTVLMGVLMMVVVMVVVIMMTMVRRLVYIYINTRTYIYVFI